MAGWDDPAGRIRELEAEVERLTRWKVEATPIFEGLQDLGRALGLGLGTVVTGPVAIAAAERLKDQRDSRPSLTELADELDGDDRDIPEQRVRREIASYLRDRAKSSGATS